MLEYGNESESEMCVSYFAFNLKINFKGNSTFVDVDMKIALKMCHSNESSNDQLVYTFDYRMEMCLCVRRVQ